MQLNDRILAHAVLSYFEDLKRHKEFHGSLIADRHKRAAFTIKWLVKCKPVQVCTDELHPEAMWPCGHGW